MVGGEAIPKAEAQAPSKAQGGNALPPAPKGVVVGQPLPVAGEVAFAPVSESAPFDAFAVAPEQSIWDGKSNGKPGYVKFAAFESSSEIVLGEAGTPAKGLTTNEFLGKRMAAFERAEAKAFELLFNENLGGSKGAKFTGAELANAYEATGEQFAKMRAVSVSNGIPVEHLPKIIELGLMEGFSADRIPFEFERAMKPETRLEVAREVERLVTDEKAVELLTEMEKAKGAEARESFKSRAKGAAVSVGVGGGVWYASLKLADAIGIGNPTLHFGFVIYTMESSMGGAQAARQIAAARMGGATMGEAWAASSAARLFAGETMGARLLTFARHGIAGPPKNAMLHIGTGLLWSRAGFVISDALGADPEVVMAISAGSFFVPNEVVRIAGGSAEMAVGLRFAGDFAVAAMVAELLVEGGGMLFDSEYDYRVSLETRAAARYREHVEKRQFEALDKLPAPLRYMGIAACATEKTVEDFVGVFLSNTVRRAQALGYHFMMGNDLDDTLGGDEFWTKDAEKSSEVRRQLPLNIRKLLSHGINGESDQLEFYTEVSLDWMDERLEIEDNTAAEAFDKELAEYRQTPNYKSTPKERRYAAQMNYLLSALGSEEALLDGVYFKKAMEIQRSFISLRIMDMWEGDPIREVIDEDGGVVEGMEDAFLLEYVRRAFDGLKSDATADDVRERVLADRKASLVKRIISAEANDDDIDGEKSTELAKEAGLADSDGNLVFGEAYRLAVGDVVRGVLLEVNSGQNGAMKKLYESHLAKVIHEKTMLLGGSVELSSEKKMRFEELEEMESFMKAEIERASDEMEEKLTLLKMQASMPRPGNMSKKAYFSMKEGTWVEPKSKR